MFLIAILSINLGVLNLLPIPILDGGHLFFFLIEAILRKPLGERQRELAQQVGLVLLVGVMILPFGTTWNDFFALACHANVPSPAFPPYGKIREKPKPSAIG